MPCIYCPKLDHKKKEERKKKKIIEDKKKKKDYIKKKHKYMEKKKNPFFEREKKTFSIYYIVIKDIQCKVKTNHCTFICVISPLIVFSLFFNTIYSYFLRLHLFFSVV